MMVRHLTIACSIYASLVIQASWNPDLILTPFRLWLPGFAFLVCLACTRGIVCLIWSAILGLGVDCLAGDRMGVNVVIVTLLTTGLLFIRSDDRQPTMILHGVLAFVAIVLWRGSALFVRSLLDHQPYEFRTAFTLACSNGLSAAVIVIAVIFLHRLLKNAFSPRQAATISLTNRWSMLTGR